KEDRSGPGRALSPDEQKRLFETAMADEHGGVAYFAGIVSANTTMRGCELKRLKLANVNLSEKTEAVHRSATKTNGEVRLIPLNTSAVWAFAKLLERAKVLGATDPEHFLFPFFSFANTQRSTEVPQAPASIRPDIKQIGKQDGGIYWNGQVSPESVFMTCATIASPDWLKPVLPTRR